MAPNKNKRSLPLDATETLEEENSFTASSDMVEQILEEDKKRYLTNGSHETASSRSKIANIPLELVYTTLPYKNVDLAVDNFLWKKTSTNFTISITSGWDLQDSKNPKPYGIPYGVYPRLLLYYICTEAIKKKKQVIHLGNSFLDMFNNIQLTDKKTGGRAINDFKNQSLRLLTSTVALRYEKTTKKEHLLKYAPFSLIRSMEFWESGTKFDFNVNLTTDFFEYITNTTSIPFDYEIIGLLKNSPMLIDIYIFLNYKAYIAHRYKKDIFVSYQELYETFGTTAQLKKFKQNINQHLKKLLELHPSLHLIDRAIKNGQDGIMISKYSKSNVNTRQEQMWEEQLLLFEDI